MDLNSPDGHVQFASFGLDYVGRENELDGLMRDLPAVRPTVAEILTTAAYQTGYGIYDHSAPGNHGLAVVALHPKEDTYEGGPLFTHIRKYFHYRLHKNFGLSLTEFLDLPPYVADLIYDMAQADATRHNNDVGDIEKKMMQDFDG